MDTQAQQVLPGEADAQGWRRLHPVTPLLRGWKVIAAILVASSTQSVQVLSTVREETSLSIGLIIGGVVVLAVAVVGALMFLGWRMTKYRVSAETVEYHSGILFRQQKQAQLDRLQAVDIVRPLLGRILGLSELRIEVAGGAGSDFRLSYLTESDANRLRQVLLAGSAGLEFDDGAEPEEAPEQSVFRLGTDRLVLATLFSGITVATVLYAVGALVTGYVFVVRGDFQGGLDTGAIFGFLAPTLGVLAAVWAQFSKRFNFEVAASPDGIRLRHGLVEHRSQTVPPGRVQALEISQPLLWRRKGWWNVSMNVAGYAGDSADETTATTLVAVAEPDDLLRVVPLVFPDLGHPEPVAALVAGMTGDALDGESARLGFVSAPPVTRWLDFIGWKRHGVLVTDTAVLLRRGILTRKLVLVPHARMQSVCVEQGPLQRRFGVATFVLHSTPGPVRPRVEHLRIDDAAELLAGQVERSALARAQAGPERWMKKPNPTVPAPLRETTPSAE